jgi:TatD DNase family protein
MSDLLTRPKLVDSHCHLDVEQFDSDRDAVLARAAAADVGLIVVAGIELTTMHQPLALADAHPDVYVAVGVHPTSCQDFDHASVEELRRLARHPKVVAIGEIGLDYYWDTIAHDQQQFALEAQLGLAAELGLPVIIHSRDSNEDLANILGAWATSDEVRRSPLNERPFKGVLHAFSGDLALAQEAYSWGFALSLGGPVTFKNAHQLHSLVPDLRLDALMLETDAPYLTPHPYRGKRNEPAHISLICDAIAALRSQTPEEIAAETTQTALRFFGLENNYLHIGQPVADQGRHANAS